MNNTQTDLTGSPSENKQTTNDFELSVVMPCLNEAETLAACIEDALGFFQRAQINGEVVIGDNGSTDGSIEIAKSLGARVVHIQDKGYGCACRGGAAAAYGKYIIMGDSDQSYDFANLDGFVEQLRDGADIVMGNRFKGGIEPGAMPLKNRLLGNPVLSLIGKTLFKTGIGDFHCGLRGFSKDAFNRMQLKSEGMEYASEMVMKASMMELDMREVPTTLSKDGRSRPPHLNPWRDGWRHLRLMFLYSPRYLFFIPGLVLMLFGVGLMTKIMFFGSSSNSISLGPATLVYAMGTTIIGLQAILFSIAAKLYGVQQGLLPQNAQISHFFKKIHTDQLLLIGAVLLFASLIGLGISLNSWYQAGFGELDTMSILSVVIPTTTAAAIGLEIMLFSLFVGLMDIQGNIQQ